MDAGDSVTVNATVKKVDGDNVVCEAGGVTFTVPATAVTKFFMPPPGGKPRKPLDGNRMFSDKPTGDNPLLG